MQTSDDGVQSNGPWSLVPQRGRKAPEDAPLGASGAPASRALFSGPLTGFDPEKWTRECEAGALTAELSPSMGSRSPPRGMSSKHA
jgi:hypothetical protein